MLPCKALLNFLLCLFTKLCSELRIINRHTNGTSEFGWPAGTAQKTIQIVFNNLFNSGKLR